MSVADQLSIKCKQLVESKPALADVPITIVDGKIQTPRSLSKQSFIVTLANVQGNLGEEASWKLAEAYYKGMSEKLGANRITFGNFTSSRYNPSAFTFAEIVEHIKLRDETGAIYVARYEDLRNYVVSQIG